MNDDETMQQGWLPWTIGVGIVVAVLLVTASLAAAGAAEPVEWSDRRAGEACLGLMLVPAEVSACPAESQAPAATPELPGQASGQAPASLDAAIDDPTCEARDAVEKCEAWTTDGLNPAVGPDSEIAYIRTLDDRLRAVEIASGEEVWSVDLSAKPWGPPKVGPQGDKIFIVSVVEDDGYKHRIDTYDADTGQHVASTDTVQGYQYQYGIKAHFAIAPDGSHLYLALQSPDHPTRGLNFQVHAFDRTTGEEVWGTFWNGPADRHDFVDGIEVSPDGSQVFLAGQTRTGSEAFFSGQQPNAIAVVAFDADTGDQQWEQIYEGPGPAAYLPNGAEVLEVSPDGERVHVAGTQQLDYSRSLGWIHQYVTIAYDAETGEQEWFSDFRANPVALEAAETLFQGMSVGEEGRVFLTGGYDPAPSAENTYQSWKTVAFDGDSGDRSWVSTFQTPGFNWELPGEIEAGPDGERVYVYGTSALVYAQPGVFSTVAYDAASGDQAWVAREGETLAAQSAPVGTTYPIAIEMDVSEDGGTVLTGGGGFTQDGSSQAFVAAYRTGVDAPLGGTPASGIGG